MLDPHETATQRHDRMLAGELYHTARRGWHDGAGFKGYDATYMNHPTRPDLRTAYVAAYEQGRQAFRDFMTRTQQTTGYVPSVLRAATEP